MCSYIGFALHNYRGTIHVIYIDVTPWGYVGYNHMQQPWLS